MALARQWGRQGIPIARVALLALLALSPFGCSRDHSNPLDPDFEGSHEETAIRYCEIGWKHFEAEDDLEYARVCFERADSLFALFDSTETRNREGLLGLGWVSLFQGFPEYSVVALEEAADSLSGAFLEGSDSTDVYAGLAVAYLEIPLLNDCVDAAEVARSDSSYSFIHKPSVTYRRLTFILAQALFRLGEERWVEVQDLVDYLDPTNGLDPDVSQTWAAHDSYGEALYHELENIGFSLIT